MHFLKIVAKQMLPIIACLLLHPVLPIIAVAAHEEKTMTLDFALKKLASFEHDEVRYIYDYLMKNRFTPDDSEKSPFFKFTDEESNTQIASKPSRISPEDANSIIAHELLEDENEYLGGRWHCFTSHIELGASHTPKQGAVKADDWGLCLWFDGSEVIYQGFAILFPEFMIAENEFQILFRTIEKLSPELYTHKIHSDLAGFDAVVTYKKIYSYRVSLYYKKITQERYQIAIVYTEVPKPTLLTLTPYKKVPLR